ncbi:RDD family protein [Dongshaea marina]|uniref:RDD family protein n=1 Tax=Dongshaea marina TaxID=2047966 RepID=UPI00131ED905|nr:RDD family protein [Dongshaea marina]
MAASSQCNLNDEEPMARRNNKSKPAPEQLVPHIHKLAPISERPDLIPRLLAMVTDWVIVLPLVILAVAIAYLFCLTAQYLGLYHPATSESFLTSISREPLFQVWVWGIYLGYYVRGWTLTGQTFGLRVWNLKIQNQDQSLITITQALIRLLTSACGLGNLTILIDRKDLQTFQDIMAKCEMIKIPAKA